MTPNAASAPDTTASTYLLPPQNVVDIINAKPSPGASLSPDRQTLLLIDYDPYPPIELLARPFLKLGGIRVDPNLSARQRTGNATGYTLLSIVDGTQTPVTGLPDGAKIGSPVWSRDGNRWAFTRDTIENGMEVWVGERGTGTCRPLPGLRVTDILGGPLRFMDDSITLLVWQVPQDESAAPVASRIPAGPVIQETEGKTVKASTYQDLLQSPFDEELFSYYGASQISRVNTNTGAIIPIGKPDLYTGVRPSPDENYLLVSRIKKPFSYRVPCSYFARTTELWDAQTGTVICTIADLPVSDEVPQQGVPVGPRGITWQEKRPATLLWVEAQDGGDPLAKVPFRDLVKTLPAPFDTAPSEVLPVVHRFSSWDWLPTEGDVFLSEYDRERRWSTTYRLNLANPADKTVLFDLSVNDAYADPGDPIYQVRPDGAVTILQTGDDTIYLAGRGATPSGDLPFLDAHKLSTGEKTRLFQCDGDAYEGFVSFLGDNQTEVLTSRQTLTQPANYFVRNLQTGAMRQLTFNVDPHPDLTGMTKELVKYEREADGVPLSGMLYLPPGYDPAAGEKLPLILWAYPNEFSDASTAGQVRGTTNNFTRLAGDSPLWFVTQGYAVLNGATIPVVGEPETMNDTFVEQIVGAARAAIVALDKRGIIDPARVLVAGHSYGAFMTANLLAHSNLFAAGIARSGAYNRTLTPFGFQAERRSYWEARDVYTSLSPFTYANQIKAPLLLIHGQADNNPGTFTVQSERFYQALQAGGATARLVLLPHESHGYRAKESVLHVLAEMFAWADKYVKNRPAVENANGG